ncbi:MAG: tRNA-dihydrouridine synthase, partial [Patescibacteria group bacterium]
LPGIRANLERYPSYTPSAVSILLGASGESGRQSRIHPPFFNHSLVNPKVIYMKNFWQNLTKPIFALAPMQDVTDCAFREIFAKYGRSSPLLNPPPQGEEIKIVPLPRGEGLGEGGFVMFTEFVNVDGLLHPEGFKRLKIDLEYTENQRPIVAQIWGRDPEKFYAAAKLIAQMGFDGVDINFGCPQDKEIAQKTCAALIREPELAGEIIEATIEGAKVNNPSQPPLMVSTSSPQALRGGDNHLPVSVKTRLGYSKTDEMQGWLTHLFKYPLAAITLHARTKQEKSKVPAHWEKIKEAVEIRDHMMIGVIARVSAGGGSASGTTSDEAILTPNRLSRPSDAFGARNDRTLIIGNGDIKSREEGLQRIKETGCDGVMVGRGAFGNPWLFRADNHQPSIEERLGIMLEHAELYEKMYKGIKSFVAMRKNFKAYISGFEGANELRAKLMETESAKEAQEVVRSFGFR